jgi:F-type H+-transporting ATPase subunit epsilon
MRLKVCIPGDVLVDEPVTKIRAEGVNGWFGILPRHVDFVTPLVPGIVCFQLPARQMEYLAIDHGVLVKCGPDVFISVRAALRGSDPAALKTALESQFRLRCESEKAARQSESKLESDLVRQLQELEHYARA